MEKETKVKDIKNLRKSITAAKAKAEVVEEEKVETKTEEVVEVKETPAAPKKEEALNRITPVAKEAPVEVPVTVENDEEDEELEKAYVPTEEDIEKILRGTMVTPPEKYEPAPFLKQLLDENNNDPIEFDDSNGEKVSFEQVALIPKDDKLYAILKPIDFESFNIKEDEALVYSVEYDDIYYEDYLDRVTDEVDIEIIFQMYYDLLDEQGIE